MSDTVLAGVDIGGTKCAVSLGRASDAGGPPEVLERFSLPTPDTPDAALDGLVTSLVALCEKHKVDEPAAIGVSCGGPLDSTRGVVLSPPNLPGWDDIDVAAPFARRYPVPVALENDANAGALAEWLWGGGSGLRNIVFLTFGTGMGAGLILDGNLYRGTNDLAGEVGHIRLAPDGPIGYGKAGSFEGFCSGGGIARLAREKACAALEKGVTPGFCRSHDELERVDARSVAAAADAGDPTAQEVFTASARMLGRGLAIIVDVINPEKILIGSVYLRQRALFDPEMLRVLREEALRGSLSVCTVEPAALGERAGDFAALAVAAYASRT